MLGTVGERVEMITMAEERPPAYSIDYSFDFQTMKGAFQPHRTRKTLAALALRCEVRHYHMCQAGSIPYYESTVVELRRGCALEDSEEWESMVSCEIVVREDRRDMSHRRFDIEFRAGSSRKMQSAGCRRDLRVEVEAVEPGRRHSSRRNCNTQTGHTTAKAGVAHRTPDRQRDCKADEH